jgi:peptidase C25-like protein/lamin tail-like protein
MNTNRRRKIYGSQPEFSRAHGWRPGIATVIAAAMLSASSYLVSPPASQALSSGIVISQVYPNGGTSGALYRNDFIELFNRGNTPINITGWSVQYAVGNGAQSSNWVVTPICATSCVIQPHSYYLIQEASSGANGLLLPTPDATGTIDISPNNGKVALVNSTTSLTGGTGCPFPAGVVDFVGYGTAANCSEGNATAPNPGNNDQSVCRLANGFTETDNNANDFTLCAPNPRNSVVPPAFARLNQLTATGFDTGGVLLEWRTGYEVDNLGFNIYRDNGGKRTRINPRLIAGSGLMVSSVALTAGHSYSFWDDTTASDAVYWIEDVALNGRSTMHEPISVSRSAGRVPPTPDQRRPMLLDSLGQTQDPTTPVESKAGLPKPTTAQLELQSRRAPGTVLKFAIRNEGWYRVTQPELIAAGLDPGTNPAYLQMFVDGQEQAIEVITEGEGGFGPNSAIEFYGVGIDAASTDRHIYSLIAGSEPGARIGRVSGKGSRGARSGFPYAVERRDRTVYFSGLRNGEKENFFGAVVAGSPVDQSLLVRHLDKTSSERAELELALQGVTLADHRVRVSLNDEPIGEIVFDGQELGVATLTIPRSLLKEGQNQVGLISSAGDRDISLVSHLKLTYGHTYTADDDMLRFTAKGKQRITVDGFSNARIRVVDITEPNNVQEVTTSVEQKGSYSASFSVPGRQQRTLLAFAGDRIGKPAELIAERPSNLRGSLAGADFVIITRRELFGVLDALKSLRERQGLRVEVVDVEDVYDEFSFGQKTPQALKDFLEFAGTRWDLAPRYVLLAGDASFDPKNYLDKGDFDLVPTKLIDTRYMETASDDWFTDFDEDGLADIPMGRLPVRNAREAAGMIAKITLYESAAKPEGVMLVSDSHEGFDFAAANASMRAMVPADVRVDEVDRGKDGDVMARMQLLEGLNRGPALVNYMGHGSVDLWNGSLLRSADVASLTNKQSLSLFVAMTCLNGYFQDPSLDSLAESLLKSEQGGAVAVWASSGMTTTDKQAVMDQQFFRLLFGGDLRLTLGEATLKAKAASGDDDVRRTWILFGDPSMKLK